MGPVDATIEIDVPRQQVFEALSDLARRPSFTDHFQTEFRLTRIDSRAVGAGARFRLSGPLRSVWADTAIAELEAPARIVERGRGGRGNRTPTGTAWELLEGPGSLTRVRVSEWTEPGRLEAGLEALTGASISRRRAWREALRRLRDLLEADEPEHGRIAVGGGNAHATGIP